MGFDAGDYTARLLSGQHAIVGHGETCHAAAEDLFSKVKAADIEARKRAPKSTARATHKRKERSEQTRAVIDVATPYQIIICVNDVLTKNDRYARGRSGTFEKTLAKRFKAAVALAAAGAGYVPPVKVAAIASGKNKRKASTTFGAKTITSGLWSLEVLSIWPNARHHADGTDTAHGDADAPLSMVQDSLQKAGIIDDDMRIVKTSARTCYRKDERRTVAVLTRLDGPALQRHHNAIESLLLAELMTNASKPAAC